MTLGLRIWNPRKAYNPFSSFFFLGSNKAEQRRSPAPVDSGGHGGRKWHTRSRASREAPGRTHGGA